MKKATLLLLFLASAPPALAESRHDVSNLSCDRVKAILQSEGSAILQYRSKRNPSVPLYDRYVRDAAFCRIGRQVLSSASIPVAGGQSCRVRKCVTIQDDD